MAQAHVAATLSVVRIINLRAIRRHTLRALLAALSLGGGVAVVVAVLIESTSVSKAVDDVGYRIAGPAPLRIVGAATRGGVDPAAIDTARQVPGVAATVPVIRAVTQLRSGDHDTFVLALGIDCSAQWIIDPKVCQPGQPEPPMMATSTTLAASLGPTAALETDIGDLSITALQPISDLDTVNSGRVIVVPLSIAKAQFARAGNVDIVYVQVADGANPSEVRARLADKLGPGLRVLTRDDPARGFDVNVVLLPLLGIFALIAVGVGVILIAQITRMSVEERRREIAIAAALGASPLTAASGFLFEAAVLGVLGSAIGIGLGIVIARPVVAAASDLTQQFLGVNVPVIVQPSVIAIGLATGVLLAVLAAILPSRSASRTAIASELSGRAAQESAKPGGIWPKALALLVVGFGGVIAAAWATRSGGLEPWQATVTDVAVVLAVVGLLSAAAYLSAQAITTIKPRPQRTRSATLAVALSGLRANGSRTTAIAGAVAVPVAVAVLLSGFLVAIKAGVADVARAQAADRLVVTTTQFTDFGSMDAKFSPPTMAQLRALPGVDTVERLAEIESTLPNGSLAFVRAEDRPTFPFPVLAGQPPQQSVDNDQLIIGGILARQNGIRVGDTLLLGSGARAAKLVVGTILATPEVGGRRIQMSYRLAEQIFGPQPPGLVFLKPTPDSSVDKLGAGIALRRFNQTVTATTAAGYEDAVASGEARFLTPLNTLKYGLLAIAFISVSATLLLTGIRRRREIALIQALGATRGKVFAVTTVEAVIASAVGAIVSAALSVAILEAVRRAAIVNVGSNSPLAFPLSEALLYAALATAAAVLASLVPAWRSTKTAPATALRDE